MTDSQVLSTRLDVISGAVRMLDDSNVRDNMTAEQSSMFEHIMRICAYNTMQKKVEKKV